MCSIPFGSTGGGHTASSFRKANMDLSIGAIATIEKMVMKKGRIITTNLRFIKWRTGELQFYKSGRSQDYWATYGTISGRELWKLWRAGILTRRMIDSHDYDGGRNHHTVWEIYVPALSSYDCFEELVVQHAVGTV